jgi:hypothetical protein
MVSVGTSFLATQRAVLNHGVCGAEKGSSGLLACVIAYFSLRGPSSFFL